MTIDTNDMLHSILESLSRIDYIHPEDIPNIDLYMDQVTTFMDSQLASTKRSPEDKILTKTMINNYAKNNLLPPPVKKKYSKEHLLLLIFIYYFKNILSIKDIESLLNPITDSCFSGNKDGKDGTDITSVYEEICSMCKTQLPSLKESIQSAWTVSENTFQNAAETEKEQLQLFSFICSLSFDVYIKKMLVEKLIDILPSEPVKKKK